MRDPDASSPTYTSVPRRFVLVLMREKIFLAILGLCFLVAGVTYPHPQVAMWVGFAFAGYAVIANDSIQTIGTFIASNKARPWWTLWLFVGGVLLLTVGYSWVFNGGDVTHGRLSSKGFSEAPTEFKFLQVSAPLFLLILTRMKIPVSTTFLVLTAFATTSKSVWAVLTKSVSGYGIGFVLAIALWLSLGKVMDRKFRGEASGGWVVAQWASTAFLWSMWLVQDAANVAVFLPRSLDTTQFLAFAGVLFFGLAVLFRLGGDHIQQIVEEKAVVVDVRHATTINLVYGVILYYFKIVSPIPMSTTWVFLGLLAGREIGVNLTRAADQRRPKREVTRLIIKDLASVTFGLIVSLVIAVAVNPVLSEGLFGDR